MVVNPGMVFTSLMYNSPVSPESKKSARAIPLQSIASYARTARSRTLSVISGEMGAGISNFDA